MIGWTQRQTEGKVIVHATVCGHEVAVLRKDIENIDEGQDPYFFEQDYSVAASTAWLVWEGSWALIELLQRDGDPWLRSLVRGKRVLELGAGTGLLGLVAAAAGGHVLLTDVASMTEGSLRPNMEGNHTPGDGAAAQQTGGVATDTRVAGWTASGSVVGSGSADVQVYLSIARLSYYRTPSPQRPMRGSTAAAHPPKTEGRIE